MRSASNSLSFGEVSPGTRARRVAVVLLALLLNAHTSAQSQIVPPGKSIEALGVPPIPTSLARDVESYAGIYGLPLAGWDPQRREIWLKGLSSVAWISRVGSPGSTPETSPIYIQSSGVYDFYVQPQGKYLAYTRDANGNETFQLYLYEIGRGQSTLLSDGKSRNTEPVWSNAGDKLVYSSTPVGGSGVNLRLLNPFEPKTDHLLAESSGSYFKAYDWSPDDKQVVFCDFTSNTASTLWLVDAANGSKSLLSPKSDQPGPNLQAYPLAVKPEELTAKVNQFHDRLTNRHPDYASASQDLYSLLVKPASGQNRKQRNDLHCS